MYNPDKPWCEHCGKQTGDIRQAIVILSTGRVAKPMLHVDNDDKCIDGYIDEQEALIGKARDDEPTPEGKYEDLP